MTAPVPTPNPRVVPAWQCGPTWPWPIATASGIGAANVRHVGTVNLSCSASTSRHFSDRFSSQNTVGVSSHASAIVTAFYLQDNPQVSLWFFWSKIGVRWFDRGAKYFAQLGAT
jgi:hypothetical protein